MKVVNCKSSKFCSDKVVFVLVYVCVLITFTFNYHFITDLSGFRWVSLLVSVTLCSTMSGQYLGDCFSTLERDCFQDVAPRGPLSATLGKPYQASSIGFSFSGGAWACKHKVILVFHGLSSCILLVFANMV